MLTDDAQLALPEVEDAAVVKQTTGSRRNFLDAVPIPNEMCADRQL
jgi:hypothetical protein